MIPGKPSFVFQNLTNERYFFTVPNGGKHFLVVCNNYCEALRVLVTAGGEAEYKILELNYDIYAKNCHELERVGIRGVLLIVPAMNQHHFIPLENLKNPTTSLEITG
jgi:hypothetical protein